MENSEEREGWSYLGGKRWASISREERFFCAHLYALAHENPRGLVKAINGRALHANARHGWERLSEADDWELGFEVCLFRDLRHHNLLQGAVETVSLKRTFDLCLFSERRIVVIEAKAQQGFENDKYQLEEFAKDLNKAGSALGNVDASLPNVQLDLLLLASTSAIDKLHGRIPNVHYTMTWEDLFATYQDGVLRRAEQIYGDVGGAHADGKMRGLDLFGIAQPGGPRYVGRRGGVRALLQDLPSDWKDRPYEISFAHEKPGKAGNINWFAFDEFVKAVKQHANS